LGYKFNKNIIIPDNINTLYLTCNNNIINNLPYHIVKIYVKFSYNKEYNKNIDNISFNVKEIYVSDKKFKKYFRKIPLDTIIHLSNFY
jgi:hypothetical protein